MRYLQAELITFQEGTRYDPAQRAKLTNGEVVWISAQNGKGNCRYQDTDGHFHTVDEIAKWLD